MAIIPETDISGRNVGVTLREKPFIYEYPDGVSRLSYDLWQLCNSAAINKWARYSPLTRGGKFIPFSTLPNANPFSVGAWKYERITASPANLSEFANYDHDAVIPVVLGFPSEMYSNYPMQFAIGITPEGAYGITLSDVIAADRKYFGVAIRQKNNPANYIWGTADTTGATVLSVDLTQHSAWFPAGQIVEVIFFYSDAKKKFEDPYIQTDFWSLMCDDTVAPIKEFTLKQFSAPVTWEQLIIGVDPLNGTWSYDELSFDDISLTIKGKVATDYRMSIRVLDVNNSEIFSYRMLSDVRVGAGETKLVLSTGLCSMRIPYNSTQVFVQIINEKDGNKVVAEKPVINFG